MPRHRIVIIGSGFAGLTAARRLKKADADITILARTSHHLFQPLLYQVATGILSEGDIAPTTREILRKQKNVTVLQALVEEIDVEARVVKWRNHNKYEHTEYDTLIVAAGAGQSYFGNDHFAVFAPGMKTIDDALELRARIFGAFELAEIETDPALVGKLSPRCCGRGSDGRRDGRADPRARLSHAEGRVPQHRSDEGSRHPGGRRRAPTAPVRRAARA